MAAAIWKFEAALKAWVERRTPAKIWVQTQAKDHFWVPEAAAAEAQGRAVPGKVERPGAPQASQWLRPWSVPDFPSTSAQPSASGPAAGATTAEVPTGMAKAPVTAVVAEAKADRKRKKEMARTVADDRKKGRSHDSHIDMSLDDFIKLQRKERDRAEQYKRREGTRYRDQAYYQNSGFSEGPQRLRRQFGPRNNYRRNDSNSYKPRAFRGIDRRGPFDRNKEASEENKKRESTARRFRNQNSRSERFGRQLSPGPANKSLPNDARRTTKQKERRENTVTRNQEKPRQTYEEECRSSSSFSGRYQVQNKPGATRTFSVASPQEDKNKEYKRTNGETSFQNNKRDRHNTKKLQPKGVFLRRSFEAVTHRTNMTLNERFSGMQNTEEDSNVNRWERIVTIP
ncbi:uncharacterized protein [Notamacropus eugenii]|uniref:uncharacterized protein isoform X2 n=1 Tax=Notamacropus eugenii TaxID=9315 RepID=UPI003B6762B2